MSRPRSMFRDEPVARAVTVFWPRGYCATSMEQMVGGCGVGRGGIFVDFGGNEAYFLACPKYYAERFADPAIALFASRDGGLKSIGAYFDDIIALHKQSGMLVPGCFIANTMTKLAPSYEAALRIANAHSARLDPAVLDAPTLTRGASGTRIASAELDALADFLTTTSQGRWSYGKSIDDVRIMTSLGARSWTCCASDFSVDGAGVAAADAP